jgi:hypothetical protein
MLSMSQNSDTDLLAKRIRNWRSGQHLSPDQIERIIYANPRPIPPAKNHFQRGSPQQRPTILRRAAAAPANTGEANQETVGVEYQARYARIRVDPLSRSH